jgi:hypothetical protein
LPAEAQLRQSVNLWRRHGGGLTGYMLQRSTIKPFNLVLKRAANPLRSCVYIFEIYQEYKAYNLLPPKTRLSCNTGICCKSLKPNPVFIYHFIYLN